ncbi:rod-binding protein [Sphingomonas sp. PAMC 26621]|uniref:rod-binding protein n=1 Tax=Sphingomonas sp. PAMC 26621 TaxID=1112213 RepID=UPI0002891B70
MALGPVRSPFTAAPPASQPAAPVSPKVAGAKQTAEKFEAVFLGQMTQLMMESVDVGDQFSGGHGEDMFRGVLAEKLGTAMAAKGGIGLAPTVMAQIIKMQGTDNGQ